MKRILTVDDEQDFLDVVSEFFAGLVFLDVSMPGISGLEASTTRRWPPEYIRKAFPDHGSRAQPRGAAASSKLSF
jgi:CheY-like chemotaxis protein